MEDGKKEWARNAEQIKAGKKKSFVEHLEERGLLHDVVGYVTMQRAGLATLGLEWRNLY